MEVARLMKMSNSFSVRTRFCHDKIYRLVVTRFNNVIDRDILLPDTSSAALNGWKSRIQFSTGREFDGVA